MPVVLVCLMIWGHGLRAHEFDASEWFEPALHDASEHSVNLMLDLCGPRLPAFTDVTASEGEPRFSHGDHGLLLHPARGSTVALTLDLGASNARLAVDVTQLEQDARLAWHIACLQGEQRYLAELYRNQRGVQVRLQVAGRNRFIQLPDAAGSTDLPEFPATLEVRFTATELRASFGGVEVSAAVELPHGARPSLAVTDARASVRDLRVSAALGASWMQDAAGRQAARRALERLVDFATAGALNGVLTHGLPGADAALREYPAELLARREAGDVEALLEIADALPEIALAQHEAGLAALLSGSALSASRYLARAVALDPQPASLLALAEAARRTGNHERAHLILGRAAELPEGLQADAVLVRARMLADKGDLAGAVTLLREAAHAHPDHDQLVAFYESAVALTEASGLLRARVAGPFGLQVLSDVPADRLIPLMRRLEPYVSAIREWLPGLPDELKGQIALYESPVTYLNAALLVAGDNLDNVAGMFLPAGLQGQPTVLACRGFGEDELLRTLVHELWHLALNATGRADSIPRWLDEGMAVYLSAGRAANGTLVFDRIPSEVADFHGLLEEALKPESIGRALDSRPVEFYQSGQVRVNYASAWAVVWYHARSPEHVGTLRRALGGDAESLKALNPGTEALAQSVSRAVKAIAE